MRLKKPSGLTQFQVSDDVSFARSVGSQPARIGLFLIYTASQKVWALPNFFT